MFTIAVRQLLTGLKVLLVLTVVLGLVYPLTMVLIGTVLPAQNSSIRTLDGAVVGSSHLAQPVSGKRWFFPRPSANDYDGLASGGSNLATTNPELVAAINERRKDIAAREDVDPTSIPADALTASGSGLDPDISPEYARLQIPRVARENELSQKEAESMVEAHTRQPLFGFIGAPRVNVVTLNNDLANSADTSDGDTSDADTSDGDSTVGTS